MYKNSKFEIIVLEFPILKLKVNEGEYLEVSDAIEMRNAFLTLSKGEKFAVLLDADLPFSVDSKARELIASKQYALERIASAIVTKSLPNKLIGNFFIKVNQPPSPTRMFSHYSEALDWIKKHIQAE